MRAVLLICFLVGITSLAGCVDQIKVTKAKNKSLLKQAQQAIHLERDSLIGSKWYAGRFAENYGFSRTESATLKAVSIDKFACKVRPDGAWYSLERVIDCHSFVNFIFKTGDKEKVFKALIKFKNIKSSIAANKTILQDRLAYGFVKKNPFSKKAFTRYWKVLKKGKVVIGMPEDYLKICWGKPLRVFDKTIDITGSRETYVYDRYFVLLENGIVKSIHKFDS